MVPKSEVMKLLLEACPRFAPAWKAHREFWKGEEPGIYNDTLEFAVWVVESYARGETAELAEAFATVERILREGDKEARVVVSVGVLEDIRNLASHQAFGSEVFLPFLGPLSRKAWEESEALWRAGGRTLAGVTRLELDQLSEEQRSAFREEHKESFAKALQAIRNAGRPPKRWWQFWK